MEAFLPSCLDSVLSNSDAASELDVIVVNDGSRDQTLAIARRYEATFPDCIRVVDKPNGNYGSAINAGLSVAQARYVRILDADDTFDPVQLGEFVKALHHVCADMVITDYIECTAKSERRISYNIYSKRVYERGVEYPVEKIFRDGYIRFFMMHSITYRLDLIRRMGYRQTEGISYTDQEWVFYPLFHVGTVCFLDGICVYRYNLAREGQTMSASVQIRSLGQLRLVAQNMAEYFVEHMGSVSDCGRREFLRENVANRFRIVLRKYLLEMSALEFEQSDFMDVYPQMNSCYSALLPDGLHVYVNNILKVDLLERWNRTGKRFSALVLLALRRADRLMAAIHSFLFRR